MSHSVGLSAPKDAYADLLRDSRGLRGDRQRLRESWFGRLSVEKRDCLFETEVLLKGLACFANPRNHPGRPRKIAVVSLDFHPALGLFAEGIRRIGSLVRTVLGDRDKAFVFHRYLETLLPEDSARSRLVEDTLGQNSPEDALFALRRGLVNLGEVTEGLLRLNRVPFRLFYATTSLAQREIAQNPFFNPLSALEFRPEYDRISSSQVLEVISHSPSDQAQRLTALAFLSLFRMLHYLDLIDRIVADPKGASAQFAGRIFLTLAVLRSDARALSSYLRKKTGPQLADSFEAELMRVPASEIAQRRDSLISKGQRLIDIRGAFECIAANLRIEMRRIFEHDLPSPDDTIGEAELRSTALAATNTLRPAVQNVILFLGKTLGAKLEDSAVFDNQSAKRQISERLRQNVWMFSQIVRAFAMKARHVQASDDRWGSAADFQFVKEFLAYFKAMGYPLLRASDYPHFASFMQAMNALEDADLVEPSRLESAIAECETFHVFLTQLVDQIGMREELSGVEFDKRGAASALRLYLGD
jgi:hypothetical protein